MCGIAGVWNINSASTIRASVQAERIIDEINYRGPDDKGVWESQNKNIAFAHARLSIQDRSKSGHQPMFSQSGRFVIVYNGEIYNAPQLRKNLENKGIKLKGFSDTEVLLETIEKDGVEKAVSQSDGMFSFAVYDFFTESVHLVRDRVGIKPFLSHDR